MIEKINLFRQYLNEQTELSETTRACYVSDIRTYADYLKQRNIDDERGMTRSSLEEYRTWLLESGRSVSKVNRSMTAIRCFCKTMGRLGQMEEDPSRGMRNMPVDRRRAQMPQQDRIEEMLSVTPRSPRESRDIAMLRLITSTDLLVQEVLQLNVQDVDLEQKVLHIHGHSEPMKLDGEVWSAMACYLQNRPAMVRGPEEALFLNWSGGRLSRQGLWKVACQYSEHAGGSALNLQALRAFASNKKYGAFTANRMVEAECDDVLEK